MNSEQHSMACYEKRKQDHVTPLLKELHWLPVKFRGQYKIATLAFCHFEGALPPYFSSSLYTHPGLSDLPKESY